MRAGSGDTRTTVVWRCKTVREVTEQESPGSEQNQEKALAIESVPSEPYEKPS